MAGTATALTGGAECVSGVTGGCILSRGWWRIREREDRVFDLRTAVFFGYPLASL